MPDTTIRAIASSKGGAGKTSSSVMLAGVAAERGLRPLVVDLDPELHLTYWLTGAYEGTPDMWHVFSGDRDTLDGLPVETENGIDIIRGCERLTRVDVLLAQNPTGLSRMLSRALDASDLSAYDLVLLDCPPNVGLVPIAAVAAASKVVVPVKASELDRRGLVSMHKLVATVARDLRDDAEIVAAIPTQIDPRTNVASDLIAQLTAVLGAKAVTHHVRRTVRHSDAVRLQAPITATHPRHGLADDYRSVFTDLFPSIKEG